MCSSSAPRRNEATIEIFMYSQTLFIFQFETRRCIQLKSIETRNAQIQMYAVRRIYCVLPPAGTLERACVHSFCCINVPL